MFILGGLSLILEWFYELSAGSKIYAYFALIGTGFFLGKSILMLIGMDTDAAGLDTSEALDAGSGDSSEIFGLLSTQSVLAFFMTAGWAGLAAREELMLGRFSSVAASVVAGLAGLFMAGYLMQTIKKLNHNPQPQLKNLIGVGGTAYTTLPAHGTGQIQITYGKRLATIDAINSTDEDIVSFREIVVVSIENNMPHIRAVDV